MSTANGVASGLAMLIGALGAGHPLLIPELVGVVTMSGNVTMSDTTYRNVLALDPGGANRTVTLPAEAHGLWYFLRHDGDGNEVVTINDDAGVLVTSLYQGASVLLWSDGTSWYVVTIGALAIARRPFQTIDMADAQVKLVYGTAGAGEAKILADQLLVDANSGTTEDLLLPPEATSSGRGIWIHNTGGEDIVVKEDSDTTTIMTVSTAESGYVFCDGTTWRGGVVKAT